MYENLLMHTLCKHTIGVKSCQLVEVKNFKSDFPLTYCRQTLKRKAKSGVQLRQAQDGIPKWRFLPHRKAGLRPEELADEAGQKEKRKRSFRPDRHKALWLCGISSAALPEGLMTPRGWPLELDKKKSGNDHLRKVT